MNFIKHILGLIIFGTALLGHAQDAVHNYGTIQIHESAMVGFHMNVINDGTFDQNSGLVGFYNENTPITISGAFAPVFYDSEVAVSDGLYLETPVGIINNFNFIHGNVFTPKDQTNTFLSFQESSFYVGQGSNTKIDGYATMENMDSFTFPVGQGDRIRPLTITSEVVNTLAKCAYFFENPNAPTNIDQSFDTENRDVNVNGVSTKEFWKLEGELSVKATITWDSYSNIDVLGEYISDLIVVGWSKGQKKWVNLGNSDFQGEYTMGTITSEPFIPNDYEAITLGSVNDLNETLTTLELGNYFLTPNGDGTNDFLVIDAIADSPNNLLQVFNRYGVLVYYKENYNNEFEGLSNRKAVISAGTGLSSGVYFYIITLNDLKIKHQGYLYLSQTAKN